MSTFNKPDVNIMAEMFLSPSVVCAILIGFAGLVAFVVLARLLRGMEKKKRNAAETSKVTEPIDTPLCWSIYICG